MTVNDNNIFKEAEGILKNAYGLNARFRDGQYEAIEAVATRKRTLVVQKTGWGKSLVYFVAARLLKTKGMTIVISPLMVLMDNQKEAAERVGLKCLLLNSSVSDKEERNEIIEKLRNNQCDMFFTTPETLYSQEIQGIISNLHIALFVIDECHCISDWGHDFRLEYGKLNKVISRLPENVSVLGTTATANDRVIEDLKKQFGENVYLSRGPLTRKSLHIEILNLETKAERYAWLVKNINRIPGSGIIYCITQKDCNYLADYLNKNGISARPYHSGTELKESNVEAEQLFKNNEIKALVATIKLGMGYDKSDIGFVIHFQRPSSLVAYYQQIGRAGRSEGVEAYCYLMTGEEDREINEYFIENAFPTMYQEKKVVEALESADNGLKLKDLQYYCNISTKALNRSMMFLMNQGIIYQDDTSKKYFRSVNPYHYMGDYYEQIKKIKRAELDELEEYIYYKGCLSRFVVNAMNDNTACDCGKCANCLGKGILDTVSMPNEEDTSIAQEYLGRLYYDIIPRLRWGTKDNPFSENIIISKPNENGLALAKYNDTGYGKMVAQDKYHAERFREELVVKAVEILKQRINNTEYSIVTNIPSARNRKVAMLAKQIANGLGIEYRELLDVTEVVSQQKMMQNSYFQYKNAIEKLKILEDIVDIKGKNIILIDDLVDSKWTLTVAGGLLHKAGAEKVYPFCLADSSQSEG